MKSFFAGVCAAVVTVAWACVPAGGFTILASDWAYDQVLRIDSVSGQSEVLVRPNTSGLDNPSGMALGANGTLLVGSGWTNNVLRFGLDSGQAAGVAASGIGTPIGMTIGPDGAAYVASRDDDGVYRVSDNGKQLFATTDTSALWWAWDLVFMPGGDLLLSSFERGTILRFDGQTGAYKGVFSHASVRGGYAAGMAWGPDGNLYVARYYSGRVDRIDGVTGADLGTFASGNGLYDAIDPVFGPDGRLYVSSERSRTIAVFDAVTGAAVTTITPPGGSSLGFDSLLIVPEPATLSLLAAAGGLVLRRRRR